METQRESCLYGTPTQLLLMVTKNYSNLSSGSRHTGTALTASGTITKKLHIYTFFLFCIVCFNLNKNSLSFALFLIISCLTVFLHSVHPFMPLLATSSGQRQFPWPGDSEGDSASDTEGGGVVLSQQETRQDNALSLWWAGPLCPAAEGSQDQNSAAVVLEASHS